MSGAARFGRERSVVSSVVSPDCVAPKGWLAWLTATEPDEGAARNGKGRRGLPREGKAAMARIARLLLAATLVAATAVFISAAASGSPQPTQYCPPLDSAPQMLQFTVAPVDRSYCDAGSWASQLSSRDLIHYVL